ncbi:MAG: MliC family protein [Saprospiraceae bacterium]
MMKKTLTIALLIAMIIGSCKESTRKEGAEKKNIETIENVSDGITKATSINQDGKKLEFLFNNMAGTATLNFNNETIELISQKPASGIWYKNEQYELRGKGNDITLKKDGIVIFEHQDDIVSIEAKSQKDVLNMTFNNTAGTVKAYLNGGEQIDLVEEKAATGIWYKNEHYELRGKGNSYTLSKDGDVIFKN